MYLAENSICVPFSTGDSRGTVSEEREKEVKGKTRRADYEKIKQLYRTLLVWVCICGCKYAHSDHARYVISENYAEHCG